MPLPSVREARQVHPFGDFRKRQWLKQQHTRHMGMPFSYRYRVSLSAEARKHHDVSIVESSARGSDSFTSRDQA